VQTTKLLPQTPRDPKTPRDDPDAKLGNPQQCGRFSEGSDRRDRRLEMRGGDSWDRAQARSGLRKALAMWLGLLRAAFQGRRTPRNPRACSQLRTTAAPAMRGRFQRDGGGPRRLAVWPTGVGGRHCARRCGVQARVYAFQARRGRFVTPSGNSGLLVDGCRRVWRRDFISNSPQTVKAPRGLQPQSEGTARRDIDAAPIAINRAIHA